MLLPKANIPHSNRFLLIRIFLTWIKSYGIISNIKLLDMIKKYRRSDDRGRLEIDSILVAGTIEKATNQEMYVTQFIRSLLSD